MNVQGTILEIFDTQNISNTFKKREFVLEYVENPQYPEYLKFEMIQDKCALLDGLKVGDKVNVHFNLKGRKWTDPKGEVKYFNSLQAWKFETESNAQAPTTPPPAADQGTDQMDEPGWIAENEDDDLPF